MKTGLSHVHNGSYKSTVRDKSLDNQMRYMSTVKEVEQLTSNQKVTHLPPAYPGRRLPSTNKVGDLPPAKQVVHLPSSSQMPQLPSSIQIRNLLPADQMLYLSPVNPKGHYSPACQVPKLAPVNQVSHLPPIKQYQSPAGQEGNQPSKNQGEHQSPANGCLVLPDYSMPPPVIIKKENVSHDVISVRLCDTNTFSDKSKESHQPTFFTGVNKNRKFVDFERYLLLFFYFTKVARVEGNFCTYDFRLVRGNRRNRSDQ